MGSGPRRIAQLIIVNIPISTDQKTKNILEKLHWLASDKSLSDSMIRDVKFIWG